MYFTTIFINMGRKKVYRTQQELDEITKNILRETYNKHGYTALKTNAKTIFGLGATVVHRLSKEFRKI